MEYFKLKQESLDILNEIKKLNNSEFKLSELIDKNNILINNLKNNNINNNLFTNYDINIENKYNIEENNNLKKENAFLICESIVKEDIVNNIFNYKLNKKKIIVILCISDSIINHEYYYITDNRLYFRKSNNNKNYIDHNLIINYEENLKLYNFITKDLFYNKKNNIWVFSFGIKESGKSFILQGVKDNIGFLPNLEMNIFANNIKKIKLQFVLFKNNKEIDLLKILKDTLLYEKYNIIINKNYYYYQVEIINKTAYRYLFCKIFKYLKNNNYNNYNLLISIFIKKIYINVIDLEPYNYNNLIWKDFNNLLYDREINYNNLFIDYLNNNIKGDDEIFILNNMNLSNNTININNYLCFFI